MLVVGPTAQSGFINRAGLSLTPVPLGPEIAYVTGIVTNKSASDMSDFVCRSCGSVALVYPEVLDEDEPVVCGACGEFLSSYGEIKRRAEETSDSGRVSGC